MRLLIDKIQRLDIEWNERPLNEIDFYRLCRKFRVRVTEMPLSVGGFYYRVSGRDFIAVDSRIRGSERLTVLFHELGHFLFHAPDNGSTANFHHVGRLTRKECEADVFALCAVIPRYLIEKMTFTELVDDGHPPETAAARRAIYRRYGL